LVDYKTAFDRPNSDILSLPHGFLGPASFDNLGGASH
jgi:hypothetical protein